ncbi:LamG-like jellyroll fold domain-containing protein [Streptosporangium sp. NPDC020145]|uniref:LamG-like jellyroll fold domain-containing protein n=1 Tax=Streptosporangium sp. NPDC020145 TaxID=3154694 RepID=UPI003420C97A
MTVSALAASLLVGGGVSPAQAEPKPPAKPAPAEPTFTTFPTPRDPDAALRAGIEAAKKQNKAVEVTEASTETARTWAFPDGHLTTQSYAAPTRVKQADGSWAWIDTTLVERDGVLRPKVAKADMEFSAGGPGQPFASMKRDKGQRFALSWPTALPRPTITGNVATYPNAAGPEADLVVTVLPTGFRHDVVLRSKPTGPVEFRIPVQTDRLTLARSKQNGLKLSDASGKTIAQAPEPVMTDSAASAGDNAGKGTAKLRLGKIDTRVAVENGKPVLILKPDEKFLNDPATVYPVTVDPTTTLTLQSDVSVRSRSQCGSLGGPGADRLWAGGQSYACGGTSALNYYRTFLKFDTAPFLGRAVGSAQLELFAQSGPGCNFNTNGIKVSRVTEAWDPATIDNLAWSSLPAAAESGSQTQLCPDYSAYPTQFSWSIKDIANAWAAGAANHGLQLRGVNESMTWGQNGWVEFHSAERTGSDAHPPRLTVSYMLPPEIPTVEAQSIDSMVDNDAIARSTDVKVVFKSSVAEGTPLDYTVSVNDSTMITPPAIPTGDVAYYKFDETSGTTAADSSGHNVTATLNGPVGRGTGQLGQALTFANDQSDGNGNDAYVSTSDPLVHTNTSFSVSSWVKLDGAAGNQTVFSQSGTVQPGFALSYVDSPGNPDINQKWWLGMPANDASATSHTVAISDKPAKINAWTHVVAVYDATAHKLRLYVDGALAAEKDHTSTWDAGGAFQIGRGKIISIPGFLSGSVDDLHVYDRALTFEEVRAIQGAPTTTSYNGIPSGQPIDKVFALDNPASFKFVVKACRTGVTPPSCNESPAYRITSDAPFLPTDTETGTADPAQPILSGMVNRPSGEIVTAKYFLYDSGGFPVGSSPIGERSVNGGERASFQLPPEAVQAGNTYKWQMQACALEVCTPKSSLISFTLPGTPSELPEEEVRHLTLLKNNFVIKVTKTDAVACDGAPCPLEDSSTIRLGGLGEEKTVTVLGIKLDEIPDGAFISNASIKLGAATCSTGTCPADAVITAVPLKSEVTGESRGSALAADVDDSASYELQISDPQADIADSVYQWLMLTSNKDETLTFGETGVANQPSISLSYIPSGPPSAVVNLASQPGDKSAVVSWGLPEDNGGIVLIDGYDVEVVDSGGEVIRTLEVSDPQTTVDGLTNGSIYTIRVRSRTRFGVSEWRPISVAPTAPTPPALPPGNPCLSGEPGGVSMSGTVNIETPDYAEIIKDYYKAEDAVLEGRAQNVWQAPGAGADAPITAELSLFNGRLTAEKRAMDLEAAKRTDSTVLLSDIATYEAPDGNIHVQATVKRTWNITLPEEDGAQGIQSQGTAGQVEPHQSMTSRVHAFNDCGDLILFYEPDSIHEDSTDFSDSGAKGCGGNSTSFASSRCSSGGMTPGGGRKCSVEQLNLYCEVNQKLGKKNWWLLSSVYSTWSKPEEYGSLSALQRWQIGTFNNFMYAYPQNRKYENTAFGRQFKKSVKMNLEALGCFRHNLTQTEVKLGISITPPDAGASGEMSIKGSQVEKCRKEKAKNDDPNNRNVVSSATPLIQAECSDPTLGDCKIDRFGHYQRSFLEAYFTLKTTNPDTRKSTSKKFSVRAQHSYICDIEARVEVFSVTRRGVTMLPIACNGKAATLYGSLG